MFSWGYGPCPFPFDPICCLPGELSHNSSTFSWQLSQCRNTVWIRIKQFLLPSVPFSQQLVGRSSSNDARVGQACESNMWNLSRSSIPTLKVPNGFMSLRVVVCQEATTIFPGEDACESPQRLPQSTDVQDVHFQQVSWLCAFDMDGPTEVVDLIEVAAGYVFGIVVVFDLSTRPVQAFEAEDLSLGDGGHCGDIGVPPIMQGNGLFLGSFGDVYLDQSSWWTENELSEGEREKSGEGSQHKFEFRYIYDLRIGCFKEIVRKRME